MQQEKETLLPQLPLPADHLLQDILGCADGGVCCIAFYGPEQAKARLLYASEALCRMFGKTEEEIAASIAAQPDCLPIGEDGGMAVAMVRRAIREKRPRLEMELRIETAPGKTQWVRCKGTLRETADEWIVTILQQDITPYRELAGRLRRQEEQLMLAVSRISADVWEYDIPKKMLSTGLSTGVHRILYDVPESQIQNADIHPDDKEAARAMYREMTSGASQVDYTLRMKTTTGIYSWRKCSFSVIFDQSYQPVRAVGIITDISDEMETRRRYQQERQYRAALSLRTVTTVDIDVTADTFVRQFVAPGSHVVGTETERFTEFVAALCEQCVHPEDRGRVQQVLDLGHLQMALQSGEREIELDYRSYNLSTQSYGWMKMTIHLFRDQDNGHICGVLYVRDIDKKKKEELLIRERADHDPLTGLLNRSSFAALVENVLQNRKDKRHAFLMLDIDNFKQINDTFGHATGDELLGTVAQKLQATFREQDLIGRMGGDEFAVFLVDINDRDTVVNRARRLGEELDIQVEEGGYTAHISCSIGITFAPEHGDTVRTLYANADQAQYRAKRNGKNRCAIFGQESTSEVDGLAAIATMLYEKTIEPRKAWSRLLHLIGTRMDVDRVLLYQLDTARSDVSIQQQWTAPGVAEYREPPVGPARPQAIEYWHKSFENNQSLVVFRREVPSAVAAFLTQDGAETVLYFPLRRGRRDYGMLVLTNIEKHRLWTEREKNLLLAVAQVLGNQMAEQEHQKRRNMDPSCAVRDPLTQLISYDAFKVQAQALLSKGATEAYVLVCTDVCNMKQLNEHYGYTAGDHVLLALAALYRQMPDALVTRTFGDHFYALYPTEQSLLMLQQKLEEWQQEVCTELQAEIPGMQVSLRSGIYRLRSTDRDISFALSRANAARKEKTQSMGCQIYNDQLEAKLRQAEEIAHKLPKALAKGEICTYLQPVINLRTGRIVGAEALVRWHSEEGQVFLPGQFLPLLERAGLIAELDLHMLERATNWLIERSRAGKLLCPISVNTSASTALLQTKLGELAKRLLHAKIDPSTLILELTEHTFSNHRERVYSAVEQLQKHGFGTAMDDFGTGCTAISLLAELPVDWIKLDRSMLLASQKSKRGLDFLCRMIELLKSMEYTVVCEGVETAEEAEMLRHIGCDLAQGYFFDSPMPVSDFEVCFDAQFTKTQ